MAILISRSSNNWIFSFQIVLISIAVLSIGVILNLSFPVILRFINNELPILWISMNSLFTPPYLYILINGIIITIAASSRFNHYHHQDIVEVENSELEVLPEKIHVVDHDVHPDFVAVSSVYDDGNVVVLENSVEIPTESTEFEIVRNFDDVVTENSVDNMKEFESLETELDDEQSELKMMISATEEGDSMDSMLNRRDSMEISMEYSFLNEKPPVSARFGRRRSIKGSPEGGKVLKVTRPKRHETLESTWKTITEGRSVPLNRHLKKSETWQTQNTGPPQESKKMKKKSESFNNESSPLPSRGSSGKLRKEPSLSQDELNRRVEEFIKKFNEDMRLQRQESLNQYMEKVRQGGVISNF